MKLLIKSFRLGWSLGFKLSQPFIKRWEDYQFDNTGVNSTPQPVFIVGAPRTGSTILYQALTNAYQLAYIDNTACKWYRNLRFGLWLSQRKYGDAPHNNFSAQHGNTSSYGGHAPSECGSFWYRWLPRDRHFIDHYEVTSKMVTELRKEVLGVSTYLNKPLLFKNLNAGQRLRLIRKVFPDAKIIFVRRDPRFVVRSILTGRDKVGVKQGEWWGIKPPNFKDLLKLPEKTMCVAQVHYLEKQIEKDLSLFPTNNTKIVHYQEFGKEKINELALWIGVDARPNGSLPDFKSDSSSNLTEHELEEVNFLIEKYPFRRELFV